MFAKFAIHLLSVSFLTSAVTSTPLSHKPAGDLSRRNLISRTDYSLNNWNGVKSLSNFDDFNGADNFDGSRNSRVVVQKEEIVCQTQQIEIVQQRLVILQELAKRIITEQICEVETQTIVFEQFHSSLGNFKHDLQRDSGSEGGYDSNIAGHYGNIVDGGGSLTTNDLGFKGQDVGSNYSTIGGSNWNNSTSPQSVKSAEDAAKAARNATTANNSTS
jgi:hypothetical protein